MAIKIDLRDLTQAHLDEAFAAGMGSCKYAAPCIIGTLIPEERRAALDDPRSEDGYSMDPDILALISAGLIELPDGQQDDAARLQTAFDTEQRATVERIAARYINAEPSR